MFEALIKLDLLKASAFFADAFYLEKYRTDVLFKAALSSQVFKHYSFYNDKNIHQY